MGLWRWLFGSSGKWKPAASQGSKGGRVEWRDGSFPMDVVGEAHYQKELVHICGGHSRHGHEFEIDALLIHEPDNPHDENAVAVRIKGGLVGYLPRDQAARVTSQMRQDGIRHATCGAKIVGGWRTNQHDEGHFGVRLAIPRRGWIDFGLGKTPPSASKSKPEAVHSKPPPQPATDGPLVGERVVIWGADKQGREAQVLADLGAKIMNSVGKSTTMIVHIDDELTPGMHASATYKKAQALMEDGHQIEFVSLRKLRDRLKG